MVMMTGSVCVETLKLKSSSLTNYQLYSSLFWLRKKEKKKRNKWNNRLTCCRDWYPASRCDRMEREACSPRRTRMAPIVVCSRTNTFDVGQGIKK